MKHLIRVISLAAGLALPIAAFAQGTPPPKKDTHAPKAKAPVAKPDTGAPATGDQAPKAKAKPTPAPGAKDITPAKPKP